ncbi:MAG: hypothetical protein ACJAZJ_001586 [Candidatus Endobugula sp.]|jgi:hypothetical protein
MSLPQAFTYRDPTREVDTHISLSEQQLPNMNTSSASEHTSSLQVDVLRHGLALC